MNQTRHARRAMMLVLAIMSATALIGCAARMRAGIVYSDPVVYVDTVPSYLYSQPYVYYRGYPAYWVDGRWYYQSSGGWVVFQREPAFLYQHRVRVRPQPRVYARPRGHVHQPRGRVHAQPRGRVHEPSPRGRVQSNSSVRGRVRVQGNDVRRAR